MQRQAELNSLKLLLDVVMEVFAARDGRAVASLVSNIFVREKIWSFCVILTISSEVPGRQSPLGPY
jgi:hypothetical protein